MNAPRTSLRPLLLLSVLAACLAPLACRSGAPAPWPGPPTSALEAWSEARWSLRAEDPEEHERARTALGEVLAEAPRWTPALRALDDLDRSQGDLAGALARRLAEVAAAPDDPVALYLAGRLEAEAGVARFERAVAVDPTYAWGHHGVAWGLAVEGRTRAAIAVERRALALASSPAERAAFADTLARFLARRERPEEARAVLAEALEAPGLEGADRLELEVAACLVGLDESEGAVGREAAERALELIARRDLVESELRGLAAGLGLRAALGGPAATGVLEAGLEAALLAREGRGRAMILAELVAAGGDAFVAGEVEAMADGATTEGLVAARLVRGDARGALEAWLAAQPRATLDEHGRPRRAELARVVELARAETLDAAAFGRALFDAGWFAEAHAWTGPLSLVDHPAAERLRAAVARERTALASVRELLTAVDGGAAYAGPWADGSFAERRIGGLEDVLDALEGVFLRAGDESPGVLDSPVESHGPFAKVVVPGPTFTARDEAAGRGVAGEAIGGLAASLARRGRFGVFGEAVGTGGPDGAVLRLLTTEWREGEHLGVPFTGLCAWCEGQDVPSRPERLGATIGGAAIHEGWWLDVRVGREMHRRWTRLAELLRSSGGTRVRAALAERGPTRASYDGAPATRLVGTGGLGDRMRLAVLADRLDADPDVEPVSLDELLAVTAAHEEGHLCDRTRFLPIVRNLGTVLTLLWKAGGRPQRVAELLEYRAQLTAACVVDDPRLPVAQALDRVERPSSRTPHDAGYGKLVTELVERLADRADEFDAIDDAHFLVHQLHLLGPEELRELALEVARDEGMVRRAADE